MISLEMLPLALLKFTRLGNLTQFDTNGRPSIVYFSKLDAMFDINDEHTFSCSVFVLDYTP